MGRLMGILQRNVERSYSLSPWFVFYDDALAPHWYNFQNRKKERADPSDLMNPPEEEEDEEEGEGGEKKELGLPRERVLKDTHEAAFSSQGACFDVPPPVHVKFVSPLR